MAHDLSIKFNPIRWFSDTSATYIAGIADIARVNGIASLIKSCKDHGHTKAQKLDSDCAEEFN